MSPLLGWEMRHGQAQAGWSWIERHMHASPCRAHTTHTHTPAAAQGAMGQTKLGARAWAGVHFPPQTPNPKPHVALHPPQTPTNPPNQTKVQSLPRRTTNPTSRFARCMRHKRDRNPPNRIQSKTISHHKPNHKPTSRFARHKRDKNPQTKRKSKTVLCVSFVQRVSFLKSLAPSKGAPKNYPCVVSPALWGV